MSWQRRRRGVFAVREVKAAEVAPLKRQIDLGSFPSWWAHATDCRDLVFQGLDLMPYDERLARLPQEGCVFFGCHLGPEMTARAESSGALVFPRLPGLPFEPFRSSLYTADELYEGFDPERPTSYNQTPDWRAFTSYVATGPDGKPLRPPRLVPSGLDVVVGRRLHDCFIHDELVQLLAEWTPNEDTGRRGVVAIMGGHDTPRSDAAFTALAKLARSLARLGFLVATGGGPGLMEAANMGAFFGPAEDEALEAALDKMLIAPDFRSAHWLATAWRTRQAFLRTGCSPGTSLGIPTWYYGHEPPNVWASHIAKLFENSLREDGLLALASHGVVFGPGNAGTVQEVFQDACQNYYRTCGHASPMILFGRAFWNPEGAEADEPRQAKPLWPLLETLARQGSFSEQVHLTDDLEEILSVLDQFRAP